MTYINISMPYKVLIAYGLPGLPLAALGLPLYVFLPSFYAENLGLGVTIVGLVLLLARLFDVVTDPLIGSICDRLSFKLPKRKSFMLIGAPFLLIGVEHLFRPDLPVTGLYLLIWASVTYLGWTLISIPYSAWGAEISDDYYERTRIAVSRETFVILGTVIAVVVPVVFATANNYGLTLSNMANMLWVAIPVALLICVSVVPEPSLHRQPVAWREGLSLLTQNKPLRQLIIAYLLNGLANGLPATLFLLFVTHVLAAPDWSGPLLAVYFVAGIAGLPLWLKLARRIGKHRAWSASMLLACLVFVWVPFLSQGDTIPFLVICILSGLSLGADMALPSAIQADVVDVDTAMGGGRRAGLYFGLWGMATKLALALAVGISFPLLALAGFSAGTENPPQALFALALMYGGLPVIIKAFCIHLMWRFPLDRREQSRLQTVINTTSEASDENTQNQSNAVINSRITNGLRKYET